MRRYLLKTSFLLTLSLDRSLTWTLCICRQISGLWESLLLRWRKGNRHLLIYTRWEFFSLYLEKIHLRFFQYTLMSHRSIHLEWFIKMKCFLAIWRCYSQYKRIIFVFVVQLDEHFSRPMKEFVSLCLKKVPAEVSIYTIRISHSIFHRILPFCV